MAIAIDIDPIPDPAPRAVDPIARRKFSPCYALLLVDHHFLDLLFRR